MKSVKNTSNVVFDEMQKIINRWRFMKQNEKLQKKQQKEYCYTAWLYSAEPYCL